MKLIRYLHNNPHWAFAIFWPVVFVIMLFVMQWHITNRLGEDAARSMRVESISIAIPFSVLIAGWVTLAFRGPLQR